MEWYEILISILSGLATTVPLIISLIKYIKRAAQEKNWANLVDLIMIFMADAEKMFSTGEERKKYVLMAIKASADKINYSIDMDQVGKLIDDLCAMSKVVNAPKVEKTVVAETADVASE